MARLRVLLLEDEAYVAAGSVRLLSDNGIEVMGVAETLSQAVDMAAADPPDVIVADVMLRGEPLGLDLPARLRGLSSKVPVVFVSSFGSPYFVTRAMEAGGAGFVEKSGRPETIIAAIHMAAIGQTSFPADALRRGRSERTPSVRERQIIRLVAEGGANAEIAAQASISDKTVETYLARMYIRYDVSSRTQLVMYALRQGWIVQPPERSPRGGSAHVAEAGNPT